ncbi:MAG: OmpA/MotB domain-containing protein [Bacteroidetes bacterium]|nr:MAG: OmpA/MotB domain-containing protein [Bacteroidota bacterium]
MKRIINLNKRAHKVRISFTGMIVSAVFSILILSGIEPLQAQVKQFIRPSWWFGGAAGANFNFHQGSTQHLNADLTAPSAFHNGKGIGLYFAPVIEYYKPETRLGVMVQFGYDDKKGKFEQEITPCNCPADLSTELSYLTIEPSLRFAPFKSSFYLYAGPRVAFILNRQFIYQLGVNPQFPEQEAEPRVKAEFSEIKDMLVSMQIGAGFDIPLTSSDHRSMMMLSPFVSFHPYFGQIPRTIESWNVTSVRAGAVLKIGRGKKNPDYVMQTLEPIDFVDPIVVFTIDSPENIATNRKIRETFPLRNYIFFDLGSNAIPERYVLLNKDEVKDFKEDQLEGIMPKTLSRWSDREMAIYYNILNILGDRMVKNPSSTIKLVGSSEKGPEDGKLMANAVKDYLVDIYGINSSRIAVDGRDKPKIPSEKEGGTKELELLREGDRRVSVESTTPAMLMEFRTGPDAPLRPVEIVGLQEAPAESYVTFSVDGANKAFSSWNLELEDENNNVKRFGPYKQETVSIPGKQILGEKSSGNYKATMIGQTKSGKTVKKILPVHMALWTPAENEEGMRYSVLYEFDDSKTIDIYEKYLTEIVAPKIPKNGKVIIQGYTDIIGNEDYNLQLSIARANDVKSILEKALAKVGRKDVKFVVRGSGENEALSPFNNKLPEERFYNRSVIIDIIPGK